MARRTWLYALPVALVALLAIFLLVASLWEPFQTPLSDSQASAFKSMFRRQDSYRLQDFSTGVVLSADEIIEGCSKQAIPIENLPIFYYLVDPSGQGSHYLHLIKTRLERLQEEPLNRDEILNEIFLSSPIDAKVLDEAAKDALVGKIRSIVDDLTGAEEAWHMKLLRITRLFNPHNPIRVLTTSSDPNFINEGARLASLNVTLRYIDSAAEADPRITNFESLHKALYNNVSAGDWSADMFTRFCYIADQAKSEGFCRVFAVDSDVVFTASTDHISKRFQQAFVSPGDSSSQFILADTAALQSFCDYVTKEVYGRPLEDIIEWVHKYGSGGWLDNGQITPGIQLEDMVMIRGFAEERQDVQTHIIFPLRVEALWMIPDVLPRVFAGTSLPEQQSTIAWAVGFIMMRHQHVVFGDKPFDTFDLNSSLTWINDPVGRPQPFYHGYLVPGFHLQGSYRLAIPSLLQIIEGVPAE